MESTGVRAVYGLCVRIGTTFELGVKLTRSPAFGRRNTLLINNEEANDSCMIRYHCPAPCDFLFKCAVYKYTYLLTYLLTYFISVQIAVYFDTLGLHSLALCRSCIV